MLNGVDLRADPSQSATETSPNSSSAVAPLSNAASIPPEIPSERSEASEPSPQSKMTLLEPEFNNVQGNPFQCAL